MLLRVLAALLVLLSAAPRGRAQSVPVPADTTRVPDSTATVPQAPVVAGPVRGVVWNPSASADRARDDLKVLRRVGFNAIRTSALPDPLLAEASRLGLAVYAELPVDYPTAGRLRAARPDLLARIARMGEQAARHRSFTHVGLARHADVADPAVCQMLRALGEAAQKGGLRPYVVARPAQAAAAAACVDRVLVDRVDEAVPGDLTNYAAGWSAGETTLGYVIGAAVQPGRQGVLQPGSPERQARRLAEAFRSTSVPLFVAQWRDDDDLGRSNSLRKALGLLDPKNRPRLAFAEVSDVLSGTRDAFTYGGAVDPVRAPAGPVMWLWMALLLAGAVVAAEPRLRTIVPRFLRSPSFFRDSVRDARGTMVAATLGHWVALSLFVGVFAWAWLRAVAGAAWFEGALAYAPLTLGRSLAEALHVPWLLVLIVAVLFAVATGLWATAFVLAARRRYHLSLWQAVMLIVWHRWGMVLLAVGALVFLQPGASEGAVLGWALAFLAVELWGALRSALDLVLMTRLPVWLGVLLFVGPPLLLLVLGLLWFSPGDVAYLARLGM